MYGLIRRLNGRHSSRSNCQNERSFFCGPMAFSVVPPLWRYACTRPLDLDPPNRMAGLLDPHRVGNSTLLAVIAVARKIQQGEVTVLGRDIRSIQHRDAVCPRIAYMP